jgi:hypothetical protein
MRTTGVVGQYIVGRDGNIVHVDFGHEPDPPAPRFPGAGSLRFATELNDASDALALELATTKHYSKRDSIIGAKKC